MNFNGHHGAKMGGKRYINKTQDQRHYIWGQDRNRFSMQQSNRQTASLRAMESLAKLMDSQFSIPGTNIRFGLDALIGLIPGAGDIAGFLVSACMVLVLVGNGASGNVLARMVFNIAIDALVGSIPVVGDLFDFAFKANQKNLALMRAHFGEGRHQGGAWKVIIPVVVMLFVLLGFVLWLAYRLINWGIGALM
jgi:hypothetical protein